MSMEQLAFAGTMFSLGVLHALEPAHGKVFLGGYLANQSTRPRDAVLFSIFLLLVQALTMMLLALVLGFLSFRLFQSSLEHWVDVLGGLMISAMGVMMLWHQYQHHASHLRSPHCRSTASHFALGSIQKISQESCHASEGWNPGQTGQACSEPLGKRHLGSLKSLLMMSFIWGLVPCPIALSALMTGWRTGSWMQLAGSVGMFSIGVASILLTTTLCFVYGSHFIQHKLSFLEPWVNRFYNVLAFIFILSGLVITGMHLVQG